MLFFWVLTTALFAALTTWLGARVYRLERPHGTFSQGYRNEFNAATHLIELEQRKFTGTPKFLDDGTEYVPEPRDGVPLPKYVGAPSKEIDHEWSMLHWGTSYIYPDLPPTFRYLAHAGMGVRTILSYHRRGSERCVGSGV